MKKELTIAARFDTSDFDKSVESMQKKLKELYAPADMVRMQTQAAGRLQQLGYGGIMGQPSPQSQQAANNQQRRELDSFIREQAQGQEKLTKIITKRVEKLDILKKQQQDLIRGSREELEIKEKIARVEENNFRLKENYKQRDAVLNQSLDLKQRANLSPDRLAEAYRYGGIGGAARAGGRMLGQMSGAQLAGFAGSAMGAVGSAVGVGGEMYGNYTGSPLRTAGNLGAGVQSTIGADAQSVYGRRSAFEAAFNPERARAAQMALEASRGARVQAGTSLFGNILGYGGAGMGAGAAIGSVVPGIGTAIGAGIGGAAGLAKGAYSAFSDPTQRALALSPFSSRYGQEYESIQARALGGNYQEALQNLKSQAPGKTMASQYYEQNYMGNLQAQRAMGMGTEGFYGQGGFLQGVTNAGFTPEMMMQMSQGILGAGGSSRAAGGLSAFGNQLGRGIDLTNAGSVLGTISGGVGGAETTRQATIKILAEGMKIGLDDSKFAEENRRFTQAAAEIISRSAANTESDFQRNAKNFSQFMGENTSKGIDAAKTAYEQYQQISSSTTGPRGVMRAAGFMKDKDLSKLSTIQKQALMQLPEEQLNENNPLVAGLAESIGISAQSMIGKVRGINQGSVSRFKEADQLRDKLRAKGIDVGRAGDPDYMKTLSSQDRIDMGNLMAYQTTELGNQGQREMIARAAGTVGRPEAFGPAVGAGAIEATIAAGRGRPEDETIKDTARDFGIVLQNFRDFRKEIIPSADAIDKFTGKLREMMIALSRASESEIPNIIKYYTQTRAQNQTQAGKPAK